MTGPEAGFSHLDPSTPEGAWRETGVLELSGVSLSELVPEGEPVVVLAAHPDDEALGAAALLAHLQFAHVHGQRSSRHSLLLFTAGEKSHPSSSTHSEQDLRSLRLSEFDDAVDLLCPTAEVHRLGLPDGGLTEFPVEVRAALISQVEAAEGRATLVAPYSYDGHGDHEALGAAAREIGRAYGLRVVEYPIWYWHWSSPADPRWRSWVRLPDPAGFDREALLGCYPSQTSPLSDREGDEAVLTSSHLAHFTRGADTLAVTDFGAGTGAPRASVKPAEDEGR